MQRILAFISRILSHFKQKILEIKHSSDEVLKTSPPLVRIIAFTVFAVFVYCVFQFALHAVVMAVCITVNSIFLNRLFSTDSLFKNKIAQDFSKPLTGMVVVALASLIYFVAPEVTIILAFFVIPQVIAEIHKKYEEYLHALPGEPAK